MDFSQQNSVFQAGLTRRGPVYNATDGGFGALPTLSPLVKYGLMATLVYLGANKKLPLGLLGGLGAAALVWQFLPTSSTPAASGAPSAADIAASTAGASTIGPIDFSNVQAPA